MRPIILGMCDPSGTEPLGIDDVPRGAAGHRLWRLSGLSRERWLAAFERRNLVPTKKWSPVHARIAAAKFVSELCRDDIVVALGREVEVALRRQALPCPVHFIPHPSGRNLAYNDPAVRDRVGSLLRRLACQD